MYKSDLLLGEQGGVEGTETGWDVLYESRIYFQLKKFFKCFTCKYICTI